ncbi:hypothetical protein [Geodermatophilus marinus]|uniref:hypothetical protein n=1 Tax=Geodermatophilus sp. LHW52908 TaxID=2303986 RepID=UPI000E3CAD61|nr:hypothetical protein [Geodermatophilus sp. LHW52908]RFU22336.1 hypothetical protein D0Z06_06715 [Geodermatophilus sp. LHW52908]
MTDHQTLLSSRLHGLADDLAPTVDVVGLVRDARQRHRRRHRGRIALGAVATATAAVVVGVTSAPDLLSAGHRGEVARPSTTAPSAPATTPPPTTPPPTTPPATTPPPADPGPSEEVPDGLPAGWEPRSFQGVTFAVPPGARTPDVVDETTARDWMSGPSFTWHGPLISGDVHSTVEITIVDTYEGGLPPLDGGAHVTVPGADAAYGDVEPPLDVLEWEEVDSWTAWLAVLDGDRQIRVSATFPPGPAGEQMGRDLIASLAVS